MASEITAQPSGSAQFAVEIEKKLNTPSDSSDDEDMYVSADEEEDIGEIKPDHYYEGGRIPVFKPVSLLSGFAHSSPRSLIELSVYAMLMVGVMILR
jgi:hypothetical protein